MNLLQREWMLWVKRITLWVLLGMVAVMAHYGYIDYMNPAVWKRQADIIDAAAIDPEEKEEAYQMLAQDVWAMESNNSLFDFLPLFVIGMSFGAEIHARRIRGARLAGMRTGQYFWSSFGANALLSLGLIILGILISLWNLRGLWWGRLGQMKLLFLLRPIVKILLSAFCATSLSYLCFVLFSKKNLVIPYLVYVLAAFLFHRSLKGFASILAWGDAAAANNGGFMHYYFWDVKPLDTSLPFLVQPEDPLQWKLWGEVMLIGYLVVGALTLFAAWKVFQRSQRAI